MKRFSKKSSEFVLVALCFVSYYTDSSATSNERLFQEGPSKSPPFTSSNLTISDVDSTKPAINSGTLGEKISIISPALQNVGELELVNSKYDGPKVRICRDRNTKSLNECLREVLEEIKPRLALGIPEIGLPGMDPLKIPQLSFEHGSGSVKIHSLFSDVEITGLSTFNKSDFWVDIEKRQLDFDVTFPHLLLAGTYQLSGNLLFVPIAGSGSFWLNLGGVSSKGSGKLSSLINGTQRVGVILHKTEVDLNIDSIKVHLTNLFNGDRLLGTVINNFLNENSKEIFEELRPQIGSQVGDMLSLIGNRALSALPADYFDDIPLNIEPPIISQEQTTTRTGSST